MITCATYPAATSLLSVVTALSKGDHTAAQTHFQQLVSESAALAATVQPLLRTDAETPQALGWHNTELSD